MNQGREDSNKTKDKQKSKKKKEAEKDRTQYGMFRQRNRIIQTKTAEYTLHIISQIISNQIVLLIRK